MPTMQKQAFEAISDAASKALAGKPPFERAPYSPEAGEEAPHEAYSYWRSTMRIFLRNKTAVAFLAIMAALLVFTFVQPLIPGQKSPTEIFNDERGIQIRNAPPSREFWLGTNSIGQDLWSRIWAGTRTSLLIAFAVAIIDSALGIAMGVVWGYIRAVEGMFTELYNIFDNIPQTLMLILISYVLRPSVSTIILALSITSWLTTARFIRNQIVIIRDRDYNLASRCLGSPPLKIIARNIMPFLISVITMRAAIAIPNAISNEVFVSYIGLGLPLAIPSLGNLITSGIDKMLEPSLRYQLIFPAAVLCLITVSFYIVGNALADASDPKNHTI
ncbi:MAG: ABC transporter permease [Eubacteriaceae bacterium]|nr:ABC transporter permease [Eubacteriaceae bacterium]